MSGCTEMDLEPGRNRFAFGRNWSRYANAIDDERIASARDSLAEMLGRSSLEGKTVLDAGCGSGLFSLAARRMGARVLAFDIDEQSVRTAEKVRERYSPADPDWKIERASMLDAQWLDAIGSFDIVYAWGSVHHTGAMWHALKLVAERVKHGGTLFVSVYNDQGWRSRYWHVVKRAWNRWPASRGLLVAVHAPWHVGARWVWRRLRGSASADRGMSLWHDLLDWLGGYPFEVARPEEVFEYLRARGFVLERLRTCGGRHGCNELVMTRTRETAH